jgi:TolB-like protein/DNA-binding winged helix-turn-helix (wHTH) protein
MKDVTEANSRARLLQFGAFEVDLRTGELHKEGLKVKLPGQPFQVLAMLLERPGELVTREEIRTRVWPEDTFIDFEHSINTAVKRLREVLGDNTEHPRYIETLPRRGYRFIAPVEQRRFVVSSPQKTGTSRDSPREAGGGHGMVSGAGDDQRDVAAEAVREPPPRKRWVVVAAALGPVSLLAVLFAFNTVAVRDRVMSVLLVGRASPVPKIESIAVLPLENLSHDPAQEYFADGMTEELITNLGKIGALRVISRTSVLRFKGTKQPLSEVGKELNVDALVEGTVLRSGNRLRITVNLLHAPTDRHLWAESYERDLQDVLALQDEVAEDIAKKIQVRVTPQEQASLTTTHPVKPGAYELYLKGCSILDNWTEESGRSALKYFEQALEREPEFAPAFAGLADAYVFLGRFYYLRPNEMFREAKQAATKALALDPKSAEAYTSLCSIAIFYDWDWRTAETACQRAIEVNPNYAPARHIYSHYFISTGRFADSLRESRRYLELDPLSPAARTHLGTHYKMARQYDLAIEELRKTVESAPNFPDAYGELASSYIGKGLYAEALSPAKKAVMLTGGKGYLGLLGEAYAMAGRRSEAVKVLHEIQERSQGAFEPSWGTLTVLIALGERDRAIGVLRTAFEEHDQSIPYLKVWSVFDSLRSDPRFQDLLRRMNFPP